MNIFTYLTQLAEMMLRKPSSLKKAVSHASGYIMLTLHFYAKLDQLMDGKYELVVIIVQTQGWFNLLSPRFFLKKSEGGIAIASVRPSVRPLCYLLLNHWAKFNHILYVSYSHE